MSELKPMIKLIAYPLIFVVWAFKRIIYTHYVDSPSFMEYWEEL